MFDKVEYWLELCDDDIPVAKDMLKSKNYLWMGFICHLIAEKAIKAVIASVTEDVPPKDHRLIKLAELAQIENELSDAQIDLLAKLQPLQIEARCPSYKERISATLTPDYCKELMKGTEDFVCWIKSRLEK
ncbi:MAG: HEPN domain-containing protein [Defluviitaleaceae bacterium]|nr:HEPN domain-containing protein [Defluviitaleaceae bacterium]